MKMKSLPSLYLLLAQLMVAINVVGSKFLAARISLLSVLFVRFGIGTLFLIAVHLIKPQKSAPLKSLTKKEWILIAAQSITAGCLFNALMLLGLSYTSASVAGMIISVLPAFIAVCAVLILKEHLSISNALCIVLAVLGLFIINAHSLTVGAHHRILGDAIILLSLLPEGAYYLLSRYYHNRLSLIVLSILMNGINVLLLLPVVIFYGIKNVLGIDLQSLEILIITGIASGFFYIFWYVGSQEIQASRAGLFTAISPVFILLIAHEFLSESVGVSQLTGMAFIILSILATGLRKPVFKMNDREKQLS
jgi:drug/metabolite transporter (DMT)-like permease